MEATQPSFPRELEYLLELASIWCEQQEQVILAKGVPLTTEEIRLATQIGVANPERVRLLCVDEMPQPQNPVLREAAEQFDFLTPGTVGLALRYGILIKREIWRDKITIVHELAHTVQYERLGGIEAFLRQYLGECLSVGYHQSPLEREAIAITQRMITSEIRDSL